MIKMRFAISTEEGFPPVREVVELVPDEDGISVPGEDGRWRVTSITFPIADLTGVYTKPVMNEFGDVLELGGQLIEEPLDFYNLPLRDGLVEVNKDAYIEALNDHNDKYPPEGLGI